MGYGGKHSAASTYTTMNIHYKNGPFNTVELEEAQRIAFNPSDDVQPAEDLHYGRIPSILAMTDYDVVVGYSRIVTYPEHQSIAAVFVAPAFRKKKIGSGLIVASLALATKPLIVYSVNDAMYNILMRHGLMPEAGLMGGMFKFTNFGKHLNS